MNSLTQDQQEKVRELERQRRFREMVAYLEPIIAQSPDNAPALGWVAYAWAVLDRYGSALMHAERALAIAPNCGPALAAKAVIQHDQGKLHDAATVYEAAVQNSPPLMVYRSLVSIYYRLDDVQLATDVTVRARRDSTSALGPLFAEARLLELSGQPEDASHLYSKILAAQPDASEAWRSRARRKRSVRDYAGALSDLDAALKVNPDYGAALNDRGVLKMENLDDKQGALQDFSRAIDVNAAYKYPWANRGKLKRWMDDYQGALDDLNRALELDNDYVWAWYERAALKFDKLDDKQGAMADYTRAIELDPNYKWAWADRGNLKRLMGDYQGAIGDLNEALKIDGQYMWALRRRADTYDDAGKLAEAIIDRAHVYQLEPRPRPQYQDNGTQVWCDAVHDHLSDHLLPYLQEHGERFVECWETYLLWGVRTTQGVYEGSSTYAHYGTAGAGYICVTDKNLWIVSLGEVVKRFVQKRGLFSKLALAALRNYDFSKREEKDRHWTIPAHTIRGVSSTNHDDMRLDTTSETWQIAPFIRDDLPAILTALDLLRSGRLGALLENPIVPPEPEKSSLGSSSDEVFAALERLSKLRDMGAITEAEFDAKKKELLGRI